MCRGRDFQFGGITLIEKDFPMPFVDTNDDVFLGEKSFATWREALNRYEIMAVGTGRAAPQHCDPHLL
jgi:hypothetical protein